MLEFLKCVVILVIFTSFPFALGRVIHNPKITRRIFSLIAAFLMGFELFLMSVLYIESYLAFIIGMVLLLVFTAIGYPIMYWLYPVMKQFIEAQRHRKLN